jgi:hypothetical protein
MVEETVMGKILDNELAIAELRQRCAFYEERFRAVEERVARLEARDRETLWDRLRWFLTRWLHA